MRISITEQSIWMWPAPRYRKGVFDAQSEEGSLLIRQEGSSDDHRAGFKGKTEVHHHFAVSSVSELLGLCFLRRDAGSNYVVTLDSLVLSQSYLFPCMSGLTQKRTSWAFQ